MVNGLHLCSILLVSLTTQSAFIHTLVAVATLQDAICLSEPFTYAQMMAQHQGQIRVECLKQSLASKLVDHTRANICAIPCLTETK